MRPYKALAVGMMVAIPLCAGFAGAQSKPACDQQKAAAPQKVEGRVVRVDPSAGKVAVAEAVARRTSSRPRRRRSRT